MGKRKKTKTRGRRSKQPKPTERLPANFVRAVEHWDRMLPSLGGSPDLVAEVETRWVALQHLLAPFDAVAVLGQLVLSEMPWSADAYVESDHPGAAHVVELAAALLASRAARSGSRTPSPVIDANTLTPARDLVTEIVLLETLRRYHGAGALDADPLAGVQGRAALAHLMLRGPGWPWQETAALLDLFEPFDRDLSRELGFRVGEAVACTEAAAALIQRQLAAHMTYDETQIDTVLAWAEPTIQGWQDHPAGPVRDRALSALWALMHAGDAMLLDADAMSAEASVTIDVAQAFLRRLSTPFGQTAPLFRVAETIRWAPYLDVGDDRFLLTVPGNDLWSLRLLFESALKGERYSRHRGRWLESRAVDMLAATLAPDEVHRSLHIFDNDGEQLGEIDGLLRCGDAVILVEAKAATMRPGARRGGQALVKHLRETLTKAAGQAAIARDVLHKKRSGTLKTKDGASVMLGAAIREIHPVLVTLDDLSSVAPSVWEIAGSSVLPAGVTIPWTVTLHELDLVCQTVESPIQFVHFLRRRSRLNQLGGRVASDELDWWMLYLKGRLYFEEDEIAGRVRYLSQTDDLDAWVLYERGLRDRPAEKPHQRLDKETRLLIATLIEERPDGWIAAGCTVLGVNGDSAARIGRDFRGAQRRARERDKVQRGMYSFDDGPDPLMICWVAAPDAGASDLAAYLKAYVSERIEEHGVRRVLGLGRVASSTRAYDALLVLERSRWVLPDV